MITISRRKSSSKDRGEITVGLTPVRQANQAVITGRIAKTERRNANGSVVTNASLLIANGKGSAQLSLSAWGHLADELASLKEGTNVTVKGCVAANFFTTQDGRKAQKLYILVWSLQECIA